MNRFLRGEEEEGDGAGEAVQDGGNQNASGLFPQVAEDQSGKDIPESPPPHKIKFSQKGIEVVEDMGKAEDKRGDDKSPAPLCTEEAIGAIKGGIEPRLHVAAKEYLLTEADEEKEIDRTQNLSYNHSLH